MTNVHNPRQNAPMPVPNSATAETVRRAARPVCVTVVRPTCPATAATRPVSTRDAIPRTAEPAVVAWTRARPVRCWARTSMDCCGDACAGTTKGTGADAANGAAGGGAAAGGANGAAGGGANGAAAGGGANGAVGGGAVGGGAKGGCAKEAGGGAAGGGAAAGGANGAAGAM
ncbi:hypothetical protein Vau01_060690 [Virgisporangium aurantiacum]|uniref:Uncharacterized protein n=1 Tax=Virgisporangium aurantiacum TaxID=175570 RepID=A0A8J3ZC56_9ACTN|nr:hypothetical protein Vau01_060690 [Virgisporangium aurantiacum]